MRRIAACSAVALGSAQVNTELLWKQSQNTSVYSSASLSRHVGTTPTFATATYLNQPIMVESYNVSKSGEPMWQFLSSDTDADFQVAMARHADAYGTGAVDTVAASSEDGLPPGTCYVYGWSSLAAASSRGKPAWSYSVPNCLTTLADDNTKQVDISDDGSTAVFSAWAQDPTTSAIAGHLWVFDGQTGQGLYIMDPMTGAVRDVMQTGGLSAISADGTYLALNGENDGFIYTWDSSSSKYARTSNVSVHVPAGKQADWLCVAVAMTSNATVVLDGELTSFGWSRQYGVYPSYAVVITVATSTGAVISQYTSHGNNDGVQNAVADLAMSGDYVGIAMWGDEDNEPTAVLMIAGNSTPLFSYVSPGSIMGVVVLSEPDESSPNTDVLYFTVAEEAMAASVQGNGGDVYAWRVTVPT